MTFADGILSKIANFIDLAYFAVGLLVFWIGSKVYRGKEAQVASTQAISTIKILEANIQAVEKQQQVEKEASDKVIVRLEKQIDDLTLRNQGLDEQVKALSIIPWDRQQKNHTEVMQAVASISESIDKLVNFLEHNQQTTTVLPGGKIVVEPKSKGASE